MDVIQFIIICGLFCFYSGLRSHKTDSKLLNLLYSLYSLSCLVGFVFGIYEPVTRDLVMLWLALPLTIDVTGRYIYGSFHPISKIFKPKKRERRRHGTI